MNANKIYKTYFSHEVVKLCFLMTTLYTELSVHTVKKNNLLHLSIVPSFRNFLENIRKNIQEIISFKLQASCFIIIYLFFKIKEGGGDVFAL